nr:MAG TPA: hypothetical protein [Caudoviricetes sp.]
MTVWYSNRSFVSHYPKIVGYMPSKSSIDRFFSSIR